MKVFRIRNKDRIYAYYYVSNNYEYSYIDIVDGLDEYPLFFYMHSDKGKYTLNEFWTKKWINERVIPYERQNINTILKNSNMEYYNENLMLIKSKAKSSMDDNYLEEIKVLDEFNINRRNILIKDYMKIDDGKIIVFFNNGNSKLYDTKYHGDDRGFLYPFGNEIIFNQKDRFDYLEIYKNGIDIPFTYDNLINYINSNILSTKEVMDELSISKQSVYNLKNRKDIISLKDNMFLLNDIKKNV